jgi:hypothetical protein
MDRRDPKRVQDRYQATVAGYEDRPSCGGFDADSSLA